MSESLIILDENLKPTLAGEFNNLKTTALESSALIGIVRNQEQDQAAESAASQVSALIKAVEKRRVAVKAPFLEACRQIDACAAKAVSDLKDEEIRLNRAIGDYKQALIEEARRKEIERQEELRRIVEQEAAERRRIDAETQAGHLTEAQRQEAWKHQAELSAQAAEAVGPQRGIAKTGNQIVREVYKFDVVNVWDLVKARPDLVTVEPKTRDINEAIALGMTECKGLRIYKDVSVSRRSTASAIEV